MELFKFENYCRNIPQISPGAYVFQRPFFVGGGGAHICTVGKKRRYKIDEASL